MDVLIIVLCTAAAVWYLYRRYARTLKADQSSCGCSGCGSCDASKHNSAED